MGYLHEGHLSLVRQARQECASVAVSIYVNPSQFGPHEDLKKYPHDLQRDLQLLRQEGVDLVWTPTDEVMYPPGYQTWVMVNEVTQATGRGDSTGSLSRCGDGGEQAFQCGPTAIRPISGKRMPSRRLSSARWCVT